MLRTDVVGLLSGRVYGTLAPLQSAPRRPLQAFLEAPPQRSGGARRGNPSVLIGMLEFARITAAPVYLSARRSLERLTTIESPSGMRRASALHNSHFASDLVRGPTKLPKASSCASLLRRCYNCPEDPKAGHGEDRSGPSDVADMYDCHSTSSEVVRKLISLCSLICD
ncbi:hypothetical protein FKP32DRAFT_1231385 [Trametes sanguinea]|nr:hypothetical protein FKP32DRAFT_1231385 [Trametes sanguinea]